MKSLNYLRPETSPLCHRRVMFTTKGEIFGQWDSDWRYTWDELKEVPTVSTRGVQLLLKVRRTFDHHSHQRHVVTRLKGTVQ